MLLLMHEDKMKKTLHFLWPNISREIFSCNAFSSFFLFRFPFTLKKFTLIISDVHSQSILSTHLSTLKMLEEVEIYKKRKARKFTILIYCGRSKGSKKEIIQYICWYFYFFTSSFWKGKKEKESIKLEREFSSFSNSIT